MVPAGYGAVFGLLFLTSLVARELVALAGL